MSFLWQWIAEFRRPSVVPDPVDFARAAARAALADMLRHEALQEHERSLNQGGVYHLPLHWPREVFLRRLAQLEAEGAFRNAIRR